MIYINNVPILPNEHVRHLLTKWPPVRSGLMFVVVLFTVLLGTEGVLLLGVVVGGGGAPQLAVLAALRDAGVEGLPLVDEGEDAGLAPGVPPVHRRGALWTYTERREREGSAPSQVRL